MNFIEICIHRRVTVTVGVILVALFGYIAIQRIPVEMLPNIEVPIITVTTDYVGAGPLEVEDQITNPLEDKLASVENLRKLTSVSMDGRSTITLEFEWGVNKDLASIEILKKINQVRLPRDAETPLIAASWSEGAQPVMWANVHGAEDPNRVRILADEVIKPQLERVQDVANVDLFGGQEREIQVILDHKAMTMRGLSVSQVRQAIDDENQNVKGGYIDEGKRRHIVRTVGQYQDPRQIGEIIIQRSPAGIVYLRDIARVRDGFKIKDSFFRLTGKPLLALGIYKKTGANTLKVVQSLTEEMKRINRALAHQRLEVLPTWDASDYIRDSIQQVVSNLRLGALLAAAVLIFFLRHITTTLITGFSIPISIIATFIFLYFADRTLNIMTLAGLSFASGMVVDNAIVVMENIFRHMEMGKERLKATQDATREVWGAILASMLTTLAVFIPILFVKEEVGQIFRDLALAISFAVGFSLVVAVTVIPMLAGKFVKPESVLKRRPQSWKTRLADVLLLGWVGRAT
ncbi:MAG: efflux RND transporter permease subunit, partial [Acidobacteria bacterium]|nr:efflux RND transporter permease subunit [Acidobacteriota bacterium]